MLAIPLQTNKTDSEIIIQVSFNSSDPDDPFPAILPMIGTMGSFTYPSADLNDPLYVLLGPTLPFRQQNLSYKTWSLRPRGFRYSLNSSATRLLA